MDPAGTHRYFEELVKEEHCARVKLYCSSKLRMREISIVVCVAFLFAKIKCL